MHAAAIVMLAIFSLCLLVAANEHGKPKKGKTNFWYALASVAIQVGLLWWGHFFK